jgi:Rab proteins geranylgeranyltransferase component A
LTTVATPDAKEVLERALDAFVGATSEDKAPQVLYQLQYEQQAGSDGSEVEDSVFTFPAPSSSLSFNDSTLDPVHEAWKKVMGDAAVDAEYLTFADREGAMDDDDVYE